MARIATASAYAALAALLLSTSCVAEDELDMSEMLSTVCSFDNRTRGHCMVTV